MNFQPNTCFAYSRMTELSASCLFLRELSADCACIFQTLHKQEDDGNVALPVLIVNFGE